MKKFTDYIFLVVVIILYSVLAFANLGNDFAPQTFYQAEPNEKIYVMLGKEQVVSRMMYYSGETKQDFILGYRLNTNPAPCVCDSCQEQDFLVVNPSDFGKEEEKKTLGAFRWTDVKIGKKISAILIRSKADRQISFGEIALFDENDEIIDGIKIGRAESGVITSNNFLTVLHDEQDTVPKNVHSMNTTYFDEVYFAQTAYEYAHGLSGYEDVHPPLGKILQAIPIALTGRMTPFTWRFQGTLVGIIIIIVVFFITKQIFKKTSYANLAIVFTAFSGLHFVQTRIGTIDSHLCLFTILSYLFMYKFLDSKGKLKYFALSGFFFGCSFATKWSGAFGGFGLAIMFFKYLKDSGIWKAKFKYKDVLKNLSRKDFWKWILRGAACFIVVPAIVYFSSYLLFPKTTNAHNISDVVDQGARLYGYHSNETTPHPYASKWYTWPIGLTPIFYDYNGENNIIYLFPNYVLMYVSVVALVLTAYVGFKKKDRYSTYILLAWLSLFLPYAFISRPMFLYHYLPASIFALLAIVNMFYHFPKARKIIPLYILLVILSFAISYPKMAGV